MWARWLSTIGVYVVALAVAVVVVHKMASASSKNETRTEASAVSEANKVGKIAVAEDEAPRTASLATGEAPAAGLERAIAADVRARITHRELTGPLQSVRCVQGAARASSRLAFHCTVVSAGIAYSFVAIADERTRRLTWCKVDQAPPGDAALDVPVSTSCTA